MYSDVRPKFVKRFAELGDAVVAATQSYVAEVRSAAFPGAEHSFSGGPPKPKPPTEKSGAKSVVTNTPQPYGPASEEPS